MKMHVKDAGHFSGMPTARLSVSYIVNKFEHACLGGLCSEVQPEQV